MSRLQKLALLVIVLAAIIAAGWWMLHAGDPTAFAKGKRVELADFKGPDPTGVPASLANAELVARGEYLARAADCEACTYPPRGNPAGAPASLANAELVARGEYLARAADCEACHSPPGGKPFAGGLPFKLPMIGTIYSTNITPDQETGDRK